MPLILLALFIGVPLLEVYVLVKVGQQIGAFPAVALLLLISVLGAALVRREGARAFRAFSEAARSGGVPGKEVADGALILFGGALLLTPGYVTDVVGLLLVLPPTRALLRTALAGWVARRLVLGTFGRGPGAFGGGGGPGQRRGGPAGGQIIDGDVIDGDVGPEHPDRPELP